MLRRGIRVSPLVVSVLDAFSTPRSLASALPLFPAYDPASVLDQMRQIAQLGFLVPAGSVPERSAADAWQGSFAAAYFHFASKNASYLEDPALETAYFEKRLAEEPQPAQYRDIPGAERIQLDPGPGGGELLAALERRRTHREFSRRPVTFRQLSSLLSRTFGRTGTVDGAMLGPQLTKTSPSAGGRHPIECTVIAWNVDGLPRGAYHYSVRHAALERLESGDLRREVVAFASGQRWIARAAFVCILTAVPARTFWKYPCSGAYRFLFLDAGHLVQTFLLLATEQGLGTFMTAALQEDRIEKRLGLDGVSEFPLYLCGAGVPARAAKRV